MVSSNDWLALLDAKQNLIQAEEAWSSVDTDAYQQRIDSADIRVSNAKTALVDAQTELDKYTNLDASNSTRKAAETDLTTAQQEYDDAVHSRPIPTPLCSWHRPRFPGHRAIMMPAARDQTQSSLT